MIYISKTTEFNFMNTCVTLGKFDGLHLGHQVLLGEVEKYEKSGFTSVMFTFDYLPGNLFGNNSIRLIYSEEKKRELLEKRGPQIMISYPFTKETASITAQSFIEDVLVDKLDVKVIVVGEDYRFGKNRTGNVDMLKEYGKQHNIKVISCEKYRIDGRIVSSTMIRDEIEKGNTEFADKLLNIQYFNNK